MQTVTNGDKGGKGFKNWDFYCDILFEWPHRTAKNSPYEIGERMTTFLLRLPIAVFILCNMIYLFLCVTSRVRIYYNQVPAKLLIDLTTNKFRPRNQQMSARCAYLVINKNSSSSLILFSLSSMLPTLECNLCLAGG